MSQLLYSFIYLQKLIHLSSWLKLTGNKSDEKTTRENSNNKTEVDMFLIYK